MSKMKLLRPAVAMIELIFAIVIMGIILMSAPMLISTAATSGYVAIQQEAINEAASRVNMILGFHWDENSADDTILDPILGTASDNTITDLAESTYADGNGTGVRRGTPRESYRSFVRPDGSRVAATPDGSLGNDGVENDMDDFMGTIGLVLSGTGTGEDYIEKNVSMVTNVRYISDAPAGNSYNANTLNFDANFTQALGTTTSIKRITTTLTGDAASPEELDKTITLHSFSCNIGGYKLEERDF